MNDYVVKTISVSKDMSGRIAVLFSQTCFSYNTNDIYIQKHGENNRRVSAKSLLGLLSLGIHKGDKIEVLINNHNDKAEYIFTNLREVLRGDG